MDGCCNVFPIACEWNGAIVNVHVRRWLKSANLIDLDAVLLEPVLNCLYARFRRTPRGMDDDAEASTQPGDCVTHTMNWRVGNHRRAAPT